MTTRRFLAPLSSSIAACPNWVASTRSPATGRAAALHVPEHDVADSMPVRSSICSATPLADAAQADRVGLVSMTRSTICSPPLGLAPSEQQMMVNPRLPLRAGLDRVADFVDVERDLGMQDDIRARGDARVQREPARVAPHHLDDHHAVVARGGRVHACRARRSRWRRR
jgi:hypothetical protein